MPVELLTLMKFLLLALLYVFLARTVRVVLVDLNPPRRRQRQRSPTATPTETRRPARKTPRRLVIHPADGPTANFMLTGNRLTIGRAERVDIPLSDVYVSDEHAELIGDSGAWSVRDLGSTNGTFLNEAKVTSPTALVTGDVVRVGKTRIEVRR